MTARTPQADSDATSISSFPEALFRIEATPAALRASASQYGTFAAHAEQTEQSLGRLPVNGWTGVEGDVYRQHLRAFLPMMSEARRSFTGVETAVGHLATTIEYASRRMDVIRPLARAAWDALEAARYRDLTAAANGPFARPDSPFAVAGQPFGPTGLSPDLAPLRRAYDDYAKEAGELHRIVGEAARQAAAEIDRLGHPPTAPPRSTAFPSVAGPGVVSTSGTRYGAAGSAQWVTAGGGYTRRIVQMSDGTWRAQIIVDASLGAEMGKSLEVPFPQGDGGRGSAARGTGGGTSTADGNDGRNRVGASGKEGDGVDDLRGPQSPAEVQAHAGVTAGDQVLLEWDATSRDEAEAKLRDVERALLMGAPGAVPRADGASNTVRITAEAKASGRAGALEAEARLSGTMAVTEGVRRDGSRRLAFEVAGEAAAEHPSVDKGKPSQQGYGGSKGFTATVRISPEGQGVLTLTTRTEKADSNTITQVDRSRLLSDEELRRLRNTPKDIATGGLARADSDSRRTAQLLDSTLKSDRTSPEVRRGEVEYRETQFTEDDDTHEATTELGPVELSVTETGEKAVGPAR